MKILSTLAALALASCSTTPAEKPPVWGELVDQEVGALGLGNWIIVAESSFPVVASRGTRTLVVDAEIPEVVEFIVNSLERSENVRPKFNTARELPFVKNDLSPGIDEFRSLLKDALHGHEVRESAHRSLTLLTQSDADKYAVLILKTKTALPYSNVFIELDTGFWDREAEDKLRKAMTAANTKAKANETNN